MTKLFCRLQDFLPAENYPKQYVFNNWLISCDSQNSPKNAGGCRINVASSRFLFSGGASVVSVSSKLAAMPLARSSSARLSLKLS